MLAVKFWSQAPQTEKDKNQGIPEIWPYQIIEINNDDSSLYQSLGWTIFTQEQYDDYTTENELQFGIWNNNREVYKIEHNLKIYDLIDDQFKNYHESKIDFTKHLKPNIVLNKKVTMLKNGRPQKAEYFYNNEKICQIVFEFITDVYNFISERKEKLSYVKNNEELSAEYIIKHKIYDMNNFFDKSEVVEERAEGREYIMKEIKSVLSDTLALYYYILPAPEFKKTPQQIWSIAGTFWTEYSSDIDSWFNTATDAFKTKVQNETNFEFLNFMVPIEISKEQTIKSIRNYIIDRITY